MMRIEGLSFSYAEVIEICLTGITGNDGLRERLDSSRYSLTRVAEDYTELGERGLLSDIVPLKNGMGINPIVLEGLNKKELISLYNLYFVNKQKPEARKIYNEIMSLAKERCPFCGGIGKPRNLDHYLAKKYYPQYSILPQNLIPSCLDCNMVGKGQSLAENAAEQVIHPFLDDNKFFNEQWIFAEYRINGVGRDLGVIHYYVDPPEEWNDIDKGRVSQHFVAFDINKIYSLQAVDNLQAIINQANKLREYGFNNEDIVTTLLQPALDVDMIPNHWKRGFYQALKDWYLNDNF
ncbi:hypothetical protein R2R70_04100 [Cobetia sp. SIMBA_158]|uniref:hypothetical protein n=1 Tax=Cobetia sp. SIMBA_158 TaxID=3081617 RepID=UPI003981394D